MPQIDPIQLAMLRSQASEQIEIQKKVLRFQTVLSIYQNLLAIDYSNAYKRAAMRLSTQANIEGKEMHEMELEDDDLKLDLRVPLGFAIHSADFLIKNVGVYE
jgi:hypothetical protein